ncbi:hypothetical protein D3C86_1703590 [compost metagenome]
MQDSWPIPAFAQGEDHARGGIDGRVQATGDGDQHDDIDNHFRVGNVHQLQRPLIRADLHQHRVIPGHDGDDEEHRDNVENPHAPDHGVGRAGNLFRRVLRFCGGNRDDFRAHEAEHSGQHRTNHGGHAIGHETTEFMA